MADNNSKDLQAKITVLENELETLRQRNLLLESVLNNMGACVYAKDENLRYLYANERVAESFKTPLADIIGHRDRDILPAEMSAKISAADRKLFASGESLSVEESFPDMDGNMRHYWSVKIPWRSHLGTHALVGLTTEITELHKLKEMLKHQAQTDSLTGVANRRTFYKRAEYEFEFSRVGNIALSVITLDIDNFKELNDQYGHPVGDQVLINLAICCSRGLRNKDLFARTGGEEFSILLPNTCATEAYKVAARVFKSLLHNQSNSDYDGPAYTASYGVATIRPADINFEMLFTRADQALYRAKQNGRNQIVVAE